MSDSVIDLDEPASPAILGSLLGLSPARIYQLKQTGECLNKDQASYREHISHYLTNIRNKLKSRATPAAEEKILQETKVLKLKEELMIIELANQREQYIVAEDLYQLLLPLFQLMQASFSNIAKKYPQSQKEVDDTLKSLEAVGQMFLERATSLKKDFIADLQKEDEIESVEELEEKLDSLEEKD